MCPPPVLAQQEAPRGTPYSVSTFGSVSGTYTNNGNLSANGKQSEFIASATVGVQAAANLPRVRGFLDYSLTGVHRTRSSSSNELQNALSASGTAELIPYNLFVDASASVSQQLVSAFGQAPPDPILGSNNTAEVATYRVSPYLRNTIGGGVDYEARLSYTGTRSDSRLSDIATTAALLRLSRDAAPGALGWSLDASRQQVDYSAGRNTEEDLVQGVLTWVPVPDLALSGIAGRESNNYLTVGKQANDTWGARLRWTPSVRTDLLLERQHRFFGNSHALTFAYRTPRTSWAFSDTRDATTTQGQAFLASLGTAYDLLFGAFAASEPDPVLRHFAVLQELERRNIDPAAQVITKLLPSAVTLQRLQQASFGLRGARNTLILTASRSNSRRLDVLSSAVDDFLISDFIRQTGVSLNLSRQLSPLSTLALSLSVQRTTGSEAALATRLRSLGVNWAGRLTQRADFALGLRHSRFSGLGSYNESAITGTLTYRF